MTNQQKSQHNSQQRSQQKRSTMPAFGAVKVPEIKINGDVWEVLARFKTPEMVEKKMVKKGMTRDKDVVYYVMTKYNSPEERELHQELQALTDGVTTVPSLEPKKNVPRLIKYLNQ